MSDLLDAASAAMGIPGPLVSRAAAARAAESGATTDEILTAWAGGAPAPAPASAPAPAATAESAPEPEEAPVAEESPAPAAFEPPAAPGIQAVPAASAAPARPPVLVGAADNPMKVFAGVLGLFLIVLLVGLVGPATPIDTPGERTSNIDFSPLATDGRGLYASQGCVSCHTQMIRPVIADVGLGAATLNDTSQVLGLRRYGPDLADVGSRLDGAQLSAIATGAGGHPSSGLDGDDLAALVAYLSESVSGGATP